MKEIRVIADKENIEEAFDFIEGQLAVTEGISRKDVLKLHMVVDEIFSNIANYAYEDGGGEVVIAFGSGAGYVSITFTDEGRPYNPLEEAAPDVSQEAREKNAGGLGVFMVRQTVDDIRYERKDAKNILTLVKRTGEL